MSDTRTIPLHLIREPRFLLRPVDRTTTAFLEMRNSVQANGFINSICVTAVGDEFEVLDGNYRYNCAQDLGLDAMPCIVKTNLSDSQILALQIQAQAIRPETKPVEFAQQLKKIMARSPDMGFDQLAALVNKSPHWIKQHLGLLNLEKATQLMVDRGEMPLQSAFMLARIPPMLRKNYIEDACLMRAVDFRPLAADVIKRYTEAVKKGRMDEFYNADVKIQPHLRPLKELEAETIQHVVGPAMVAAEQCNTPLDGFYAALKWVCHLDAESVMLQEQAIRKRQRKERMAHLRDAASQI